MTYLSKRVRQLAKEMAEGDPVTAAMLIAVAKTLESESREATLMEIEKEAKGWFGGGPYYCIGDKVAERFKLMRLKGRKKSLAEAKGILE